MSTKLVVGLGNPGQRYSRTRHNIGFQCIDRLASLKNVELARRLGYALVGEVEVDGAKVLLAKPQTYMNRSGESVAFLARRLRATPEELLVVYDDMDLPLGKIRVRAQGSSGGQKGVQSIIEHLGSNKFPRVRVGIGRPEGGEGTMTQAPAYREEVIDSLLSRFTAEEEVTMQEARERAVEAVLSVITEGPEKAMNRYNSL